jgi:hypothetical protein
LLLLIPAAAVSIAYAFGALELALKLATFDVRVDRDLRVLALGEPLFDLSCQLLCEGLGEQLHSPAPPKSVSPYGTVQRLDDPAVERRPAFIVAA